MSGRILSVRYAVLITSIWEIIFFSIINFYGDLVGAFRMPYGSYLDYPPGMIAWIVVVAIFSGIIPFCFTKIFDDD